MKKLSLAFIISLCALLACQKEDSTNLIEAENTDVTKDIHVCSARLLTDHSRAFGEKRRFWENGSTLRVKFLGGSTYLQNKVKEYAGYWEAIANIKFEFVDSGESEIRVAFEDDGSWSYVGTDNLYISQLQPTMNFGWFHRNTSEFEFRRTIIHEFGHALGLQHEHQHPLVDIPWNKPAVYAHYARQDWSRQDVDNNIFREYSDLRTNYTAYDRLSIMHYPVPNSLTIGNYQVGWNTRLSEMDKEFMALIYPGDPVEEEFAAFCEDFQSQRVGDLQSNEKWSLWSVDSDPALVENYGWGNLLRIERTDTRIPDVLFNLDDITSGHYELSMDMWIQYGRNAYLNLQKFANEAGREFGFQLTLAEGSALLEVGSTESRVNFEHNRWLKLVFDMDLNFNRIVVRVNDEILGEFPASWTLRNQDGVAQVGAIDFYGLDSDTQFWIDNLCLSEKTDLPN